MKLLKTYKKYSVKLLNMTKINNGTINEQVRDFA